MEGYLDFCYKPVLACSSQLPNSSTTCSLQLPTNTSFVLWYKGDFEPCFGHLVFIASFNALFGLMSSLYAGLKRTQFKRKRKALGLVVRMLLCLCIILNGLVEFVGSFWLAVDRPYSALFSNAVLIVSWCVHVLSVWVLASSTQHYGRGPLTLHMAWLLTLIGAIFQLRTDILWTIHSSKYQRSGLTVDEAYFSLLMRITTYVYFGLQTLYLVTLLFNISRVTGNNVKWFPNQNSASTQWENSAEQSVRQHLVSSHWSPKPTTYGTLVSGSFNSNLMAVRPRVDLRKHEASEDGANPFSLLSFWWIQPLMKKGALGLLRTPNDLLQLPQSLDTDRIRAHFRRIVTSSEQKRREKVRRPKKQRHSEDESSSRSSVGLKYSKWALVGHLNRAFGLHYYPLGLIKLVSDLLGFGGPLLLYRLVSFIENKDEPMYHGYLYGLGLFLFTFLAAFLLTHLNFQINKVGLKIRAALVTEIYRKALCVNATTLSTFSTGQVVNFMSTDTDRIVNFCASFHQFWSLPFQIIISLGLLYQQVGLAFLAGLVFCVLLIPVNRWLAVKIGKLSTEMMSHKDSRVKMMSELLTGIRVVKFYAWEANFIRHILGIRSLELKSLKGRKYLDALCVYFWATTPVLISILTFATYVAMGNTLTAAKVFTSIALFGILISPLNAFPWVINGLVEAWVSTKRVQAFLQLEEIGPYYGLPEPSPSVASPVGTGAKETQSDPNQSPGLASLVDGKQQVVVCVHAHVEEPVTTGNETTAQSGFSSAGKVTKEDSGSGTVSMGTGIGAGSRVNEYREKLSGSVSIGAAQECTDIIDATIYSHVHPKERQPENVSCADHVIQIRDGFFSWSKLNHQTTVSACSDIPKHEDSNTDPAHKDGDKIREDVNSETAPKTEWMLSGIHLAIKPGELVGVIGKVGSGKSSLLAAITAEIEKKEGEVSVVCLSDGFGLTSQEAWIQHATVRENILFGKPFHADKYREIVYGCALEQDLKVLPAGDRTEVGENGVTLSGGQKARLALARAVYQDKSVYLLDDPLAAVDAHVASHLFTHCIMGLLRHKTRVLCTHHLRFLKEADAVVVMERGRIVSYGSPSIVLPSVEPQLSLSGEAKDDSVQGENGDLSSGGEVVRANKPKENAQQAAQSEHYSSNVESMDSDLSSVPEHDVLVKEEEKKVGVVRLSVYKAYWSSVGYLLAPTILVSLLLMQASRNITDWWLSYWISNAHNETASGMNISDSSILDTYYSIPMSSIPVLNPGFRLTTNESIPIFPLVGGTDNLAFYLGIYGGLAAANSVCTLFRAFLYAYGGVRAAMVIHRKLLLSIIRAPTSFFDVTPIGRVLNRFSSDLYAIDDSLPFILNILLAQFFGIIGTLIITCYGLPWFTLLLIPLGLLYYHIQHYYRRTSRELKRLSTVTLSPVYAHFSESLTGLCTIRALRASERFMDENKTKLEVNQRANYGSYAVAQWLGIRLQMLGVAMVTGVAFTAVLEHHLYTVDPGLVGLAISYALSITNLLSGVVTSFTETEKEMVSVERAMQYIEETPVERELGTIQPPVGWPSRGVVEFRKVLLIYRDGVSPALREISLTTKPMEKLGVVGRTGAGKSSLFQALFRMVELTSGCILIDGINISCVSLYRLRSVLAVIPQDPFLFSGSVRDNLDLCHEHSDHEVWSALERCHLKAAVRDLGGLDCDVQERGRIFSVGQRQLLCLARALLRRARVICIDEATASVDMETDSQIQQTIRSEFVTSTVITIAHRIETVLSSDRILVMEQGDIRELGTPRELLDNQNTLFAKLFREHTK